jgi:hypothetical protein
MLRMADWDVLFQVLTETPFLKNGLYGLNECAYVFILFLN